jgi:hypothetical protein
MARLLHEPESFSLSQSSLFPHCLSSVFSYFYRILKTAFSSFFQKRSSDFLNFLRIFSLVFGGIGFVRIINLQPYRSRKGICKVVAANGVGQITISGGALAAGSYFYQLYIHGKMVDSKKMVLLK